MKRYFKVLISLAVLTLAGFPAFSQQITKFGVVDTAKVYNAYFRNSAPVRNYEKKKAEFQEEINNPFLPCFNFRTYCHARIYL